MPVLAISRTQASTSVCDNIIGIDHGRLEKDFAALLAGVGPHDLFLALHVPRDHLERYNPAPIVIGVELRP